jgi:NADH dehydrogenase (ubiquinone) Fe-S protein 6
MIFSFAHPHIVQSRNIWSRISHFFKNRSTVPPRETPQFSQPKKKKRPAMELIAEVPPIEVEGRIAACDGGGGPLGHPRVFINLEYSSPESPAVCDYCGLRFYQKGTKHVTESLRSLNKLHRNLSLPNKETSNEQVQK